MCTVYTLGKKKIKVQLEHPNKSYTTKNRISFWGFGYPANNGIEHRRCVWFNKLLLPRDPIGYKRRSRFVIGRDRRAHASPALFSPPGLNYFSISANCSQVSRFVCVVPRYLVICIRKVSGGSETSCTTSRAGHMS